MNSEIIANNIRKICKEKNISMKNLLEECSINRNFVYDLTHKNASPSYDKISKIAEKLGVSVDSISGQTNRPPLFGGENSELELISLPKDIIQIPVYGTIPAGPPEEAEQYIIEYIDIPHEWTKGGKEYFGLVVRGDSMYPQYLEGDIVILRRQPTIEQGRNHAVYVNGFSATLKKVTMSQDGITLTPLNPNYAPQTYGANDPPVTVCGVVVELRRREA